MNRSKILLTISFFLLTIQTIGISKHSYAIGSVDIAMPISSTIEQKDTTFINETNGINQENSGSVINDGVSGFSIHGSFLSFGLAIDNHNITEYFGDNAVSSENYRYKSKSTIMGYSLLFSIPFVPIVDLTVGGGIATRKYDLSPVDNTLPKIDGKVNLLTYQLKVVYPVNIIPLIDIRVGLGYQAFSGTKSNIKSDSGDDDDDDGDDDFNNNFPNTTSYVQVRPNYSVINAFIGVGF